jgi:hypothetical protein
VNLTEHHQERSRELKHQTQTSHKPMTETHDLNRAKTQKLMA